LQTPIRNVSLPIGFLLLSCALLLQACGTSGAGGIECWKSDPSGKPGSRAIEGCPCRASPKVDYCCSLGYGLNCGADGTWHGFVDGPCNFCHPPSRPDGSVGTDEDAGSSFVCDEASSTAPELICREVS
jgi:hypothetical protein